MKSTQPGKLLPIQSCGLSNAIKSSPRQWPQCLISADHSPTIPSQINKYFSNTHIYFLLYASFLNADWWKPDESIIRFKQHKHIITCMLSNKIKSNQTVFEKIVSFKKYLTVFLLVLGRGKNTLNTIFKLNMCNYTNYGIRSARNSVTHCKENK